MRFSAQIEFDKTMDVEIPQPAVTIGRASGNDIVVPHDSISRNHCTVQLSKGVFTITDHGSSNGTFIDGERIAPNKPKNFLATSQIILGKIECEFSEGGLTTDQLAKAQSVKASINQNATTTIRISRLDLNKPSKTLEMEKKKLVKGPRNPITEGIQSSGRVKEKNSKVFWIVVFVFLSIAVWALIQLAMP